MHTAEQIVAALRRAAALIFLNVWLLAWAFVYTFAGPLMIFIGTGVPVAWWALAGYYFEPSLLFTDPAAFVLGHWPMILWSAAGCAVGFALYLVVLLFYHGALTGAALRGLAPAGPGAVKMSAGVFWDEGGRMLGPSAGVAALAGLLPLLPALALFALAGVLALRAPDLITGQLDFRTPWVLVVAATAGLAGALTAVTGWLAFLWYQFGLCAARLDGTAPGASLGSAWRFFTANWKLVVGYVIALIVLALLGAALTMPFSWAGRIAGDTFAPLGIALQIVAAPLGVLISVFVDLWTKIALVALYARHR